MQELKRWTPFHNREWRAANLVWVVGLVWGLMGSLPQTFGDVESSCAAPEASASATSAPASEMDEAVIVDRLIERIRSFPERRRQEFYGYDRHTIFEELDRAGEVTRRETKEHSVTNLGGISLERLIRMDGRPPSRKEQREDAIREEENRRRYLERDSAKTKTKPRPSRRSLGEDDTDWFDESFLRAYAYTLNGVDTVQDRDVYVLSFQALPGRDGGKIADRVLSRIQGQIWVDQEEFEIVKMEAALTESLNLMGGLVAALDKLEWLLERQRLEDGTWVNTRLNGAVEGRRLWSAMRLRLEVVQEGIRLLSREAVTEMLKQAEQSVDPPSR